MNELPDPLALPTGATASSREEWETICRPNVASLILREEYGQMPPEPRLMIATVIGVDLEALGGRARVRDIDVVTKQPNSTLRLLAITPRASDSPAPCFLGLNFGGNHRLLASPMVRPPREREADGARVEAERGADSQTWPVELIIERGYGLVTLYNGDVVPDDKNAAAGRLADFLPEGMAASDESAPGTIACWAWSLSRTLDYLAIDEYVDHESVALVGHSRNGKAALLAGAMDDRAAMVIPSQSGCGGAGPCRDIGEEWGARETVERINTAFPHWFCGNFKRYNDDPDRLPFDQHALIALCAPRPFLLSSAADDLWANPAGSFAMLKAADPVYRLITGEGVDAAGMPPAGILSRSRLGHYLRSGRHAMTGADWSAWLDYADIWLR